MPAPNSQHDANPFRLLLVPGGGGSGPDHWQTYWEAEDDRSERVLQTNWDAGTCSEWVSTLDRQVRASTRPTVLVAHSLGNAVVCHWASTHKAGSVVGALLVAPADLNGDWVTSGSLYERFRPLPMKTLPFPSVLVASTNDPYISLERAENFASAWGSMIKGVGPLGHIGSDQKLKNWPEGRRLLDELLAQL